MKLISRTSNIVPEEILSVIRDSIPNDNSYDKVLMRFAISVDVPVSKIIFGRIDFLNPNDELPDDKVLDYKSIILTQFITSFENFCAILEKINYVQEFEVNGAGKVFCKLEQNIRWENYEAPSQKHYGYIKHDYPLSYFSSRVEHSGLHSYHVLAGKDLPPYSELSDAIYSFMGLYSDENYRGYLNDARIIIVIPDYRAKIEKLKIFENKLELAVKINIDPNDIVCQFNIDEKTWTDVSVNNKIAQVTDISDPKEILAVVLNKKTNEILDYKQVNLNWIKDDSSIELEESEDVIKEWINRGESDFIEFKEVLKHEDDVMKTTVAFANTKGGIIIIGVNDEGVIVGYDESLESTKNRFERMVAQKCDPRVDFEIHRMEDDKITYIKIKQGNQPIYAITNGPVYVRKGASDVHIKPSELMERFKQKPPDNILY